MARHRFRRDRQGRFRLGLEDPERNLLSMLPRQVQELLEQDDPSTARVFPVAYTDDARAEADYREMMGTQLLHQHQRSLDTLAATAGAATIDESEIHEWLDAVEVLRLVLGTQLDVSRGRHHDGRHRSPLGAVHRLPLPEHGPGGDRRGIGGRPPRGGDGRARGQRHGDAT